MPLVKTKQKQKEIALSPALRLERAVANCIIADRAAESGVGRGPYPPRMEPYWKAFKSQFTPGTPFTLYCPFVNQVHLFVYEPNYSSNGVPREEFNPNCEIIASRLVNIAKAAARLGEKNCVAFDFRGTKKPVLPPDFHTHWRKYRSILPDADALIYLMSVDIMPLPKLYLM